MVGFVSFEVSDIPRLNAERRTGLGIAFRGIMLTSVRNRGELAEGWYDPSTKNRAQESASSYERSDLLSGQSRASPDYVVTEKQPPEVEDENSDDDMVGPILPGHRSSGRRSGPAIPRVDDLELRRGTPLRILRPLRII